MNSLGTNRIYHIPPSFRGNQKSEQLFSRIVDWSIANHPFYQRLYADSEASIPILTRAEIQRHQKEFLNGHRATGRTSGSTGEPISMSWTPQRAQLEKNDSDEYFKHFGGRMPTARILSLAAHQAAENLFEVTLPAERQVEFLIRQHLEKGAVALTTIPSNIELLCSYILDKQFDFSFVRRVGCIAELFEQHHEQLINKAFPNAAVWSTYSCSEMGVLAVRCPYNPRYHHILSHKIGLEVLDETGQPCKDGQQGNLVLTDFMNTQTPFIRYDIADRAAPGHCDCDRIRLPALQDLSGKQIGTFLVSDGRRVLFNELKVVLRDLPMIAQFQLVQEALDEFTVYYVKRKEEIAQGNFEPVVIKHFQSQVGPQVKVHFVQKSEFPRAPSGKVQVTLSRV